MSHTPSLLPAPPAAAPSPAPPAAGIPAAPGDAPPRLSPAERLAAARETLASVPPALAADPAALAAFLRFRACFRAFSLANTLLLFAQRPSARYCMGFRQWLAHGRAVRRGERGLAILVPRFAPRGARPAPGEAGAPEQEGEPGAVVGFVVGYVFDIEQTEVGAGREADALRYVSPLPVLAGDDHGPLFRRLCRAAEAAGWSVEEAEALAGEGVCCPASRRLRVRASLGSDARCAVLAHELAHAFAHVAPAPGTAPTAGTPGVAAQDAAASDAAAREVEAEGAALLACAALGLDTSAMSVPYLSAYLARAEGRTASSFLAAADAIAARIVAAVAAAEDPGSVSGSAADGLPAACVSEPCAAYATRPAAPRRWRLGRCARVALR